MRAHNHLPAAERAGIYGFFSRLFVREIDDRFAAVLAGELGRALLPEFADSGEAAAVRDPGAREALLDPDFVSLTIVNLTPYESFFRREDAMLETGGQNPAARFMAEYGFEVDLEVGRVIGPDHLGVELEFMSQLCAQEATAAAEAEAGERGDGGAYAARIRAAGRAFLSRHLLAWAPVYLLAAGRNARTVLYREGAEAALDFLLADHEALAGGTSS